MLSSDIIVFHILPQIGSDIGQRLFLTCKSFSGFRSMIYKQFLEYNGKNNNENLRSALAKKDELWVVFFKNKQRNINGGLTIAAEYNRRDLVDHFLEKGASDINLAIIAGSKNRHITLTKYLLKYVNTHPQNYKDIKYDNALVAAAEGGSLELVQEFVQLGAVSCISAMGAAARGGHVEIVNYFLASGIQHYNWGMSNAAENGHLGLVQYFIDLGANDWNWGLWSASYAGRIDMVKFFIDKGANEWAIAMLNAARGDHYDLVEFFYINHLHPVNMNKEQMFAYLDRMNKVN